MERQKDRLEFWVRFVCAFLFFGLLAGGLALRFMHEYGVGRTFWISLIFTLLVSTWLAWKGDAGWKTILSKADMRNWW